MPRPKSRKRPDRPPTRARIGEIEDTRQLAECFTYCTDCAGSANRINFYRFPPFKNNEDWRPAMYGRHCKALLDCFDKKNSYHAIMKQLEFNDKVLGAFLLEYFSSAEPTSDTERRRDESYIAWMVRKKYIELQKQVCEYTPRQMLLGIHAFAIDDTADVADTMEILLREICKCADEDKIPVVALINEGSEQRIRIPVWNHFDFDVSDNVTINTAEWVSLPPNEATGDESRPPSFWMLYRPAKNNKVVYAPLPKFVSEAQLEPFH
ncbi:hypothetical protein F4780DRAFT_233088 [Xylariomycetidae sp. FL0641]|nr:hypothetical protein F4780DRAFT_233088 [Xylariomycetidae sp. FL0641]